MAEPKAGQNGEYFWIEFSGNKVTLYNILSRCSEILYKRYLAVICFDSGPLQLVDEEKKLGWYEKNNIAFSPMLTADLISALPTEQYDQWCLFNESTDSFDMTSFVNYGSFTLSSRRHELIDADPTWDRLGIEKRIEHHEQLLVKFWNEILTISPDIFISDGDNLIFVTKEKSEIELLKMKYR